MMARWLNADEELLPDRNLIRFAANHNDDPLQLHLTLLTDQHEVHPFTIEGPDGVTATSQPIEAGGGFNVCVTVPPAQEKEDDEHFIALVSSTPDIPSCRIHLRRTTCKISSALIERHLAGVPVRCECRAALLWYGWRRFSEIQGLKRFTSGKSGSDVLVFRPKLRDPEAARVPEDSHVDGVISQAWGSYLLVKTGEREKVKEEWDRFNIYLTDRLHPFMSRSETYLEILLAESTIDAQPADASQDAQQATVIGSFLGGNLLRAEAFEQLAQGSADTEHCTSSIDRVFNLLGDWYAGSDVRPLRQWHKLFNAWQPNEPLKLFGMFDLSVKQDRVAYCEALSWDVPFIKGDHLHTHWLGKNQDGLIHRLMDWPVRFSLVHGDLHSRNFLADEDNVWLLDFGATGVAPTLFDFAKLEIYLRLWCLRLSPEAQDFEQAAFSLETQLLDRLTGSEASLEPVRDFAVALGAQPEDLVKIAQCICHVRDLARRYMLGSPDCRDYLAVLFLTAVDSLRFAGRSVDLTENYRLLVSLTWVLEDVLSRIVGLAPYARNRAKMDVRRLTSPQWLARDGAPRRVEYVLQSQDHGVLAPLAAARGVLQNDHHHLDVLDHTLLVLAYVERLLDDPVAGFTDPAALDQQVLQDLANQGIHQPAYANPLAADQRPDFKACADHLDAIRGCFDQTLTEEVRQAVKWGALFHDVGKPATRCVNVHGKEQRKEIQFLGHEVYGAQLITDHLDLLFADHGDSRTIVNYLVLRHHDHHNLVNLHLPLPRDSQKEKDNKAKRLKILREFLAAGRLGQKDWNYLVQLFDPDQSADAAYFPLLILHGFADILACRGPATKTSPLQVAEVDLLMLALFSEFPNLKARMEAEEG